MRITYRMFIGFVIVSFCFNMSVFGENLISNASFEEMAEGKPTGWLVSNFSDAKKAELKVQRGNAKNGDYCLMIQVYKQSDVKFYQSVELKPDIIYHLSGYVKTENVCTSSTGACLYIQRESERYVSKDIRGTNNDWQPLNLYFKAVSEKAKISIGAGLGTFSNENIGNIYYDDFKLETVDQVPKDEVFVQLKPIDKEKEKAKKEEEQKKRPHVPVPSPIVWMLGFIILISCYIYYHFRNFRF